MAHSDVHTLNLRTWDTFHGIRYFANIIKVIDLETENTLDYSGRPSSIKSLKVKNLWTEREVGWGRGGEQEMQHCWLERCGTGVMGLNVSSLQKLETDKETDASLKLQREGNTADSLILVP